MATAVPHASGPTRVDRAFQLGYVATYRLLKAYWRVRHPHTRGALTLLWSDGEVLLVRNSYVPYFSAPGGYVGRREAPRAAALRELREEVGLRFAPDDLELALEVALDWEHKRDHVTVFNTFPAERPRICIDHREVVDAVWFTPGEALELDLFPPLRDVIRRTPVRRP